MDHKHIVAFGGLRVRPGDMSPVIDYILSLPQEILHLPQKPRPRICMIPTATGDSPASLLTFYNRVPGAWAARTHLALFDRTVRDIRSFLLNQDIIMVGGGNTANMLAVWRVHGVDEILREAWEAGILLCGGSAGSLCWFECGTTDSFDLSDLHPLHDGLGFLPGSHCPHFDGEDQRRPLYHKLISEGFPAGYAIDEDAAIHFVGTEAAKVVTGRHGATAYRVELRDGKVVETALEAELLDRPRSP